MNTQSDDHTLLRRLIDEGYLSALGLVLLTSVVALSIDAAELSIADTIFLPVVLIASLRWGLGPAMVTSALSIIAYITFVLTSSVPVTTGLVIHFGEMSVVFGMISFLAWKSQTQASDLRERAHIKAELLRLSHEVAATSGIEKLGTKTVKSLSEIMDGEAMLWIPDKQRLVLLAVSSENMKLAEHDSERAQQVWRTGKGTNPEGEEEPGQKFFYPLLSAGRTIGVLEIHTARKNWLSDPRRQVLVETLTATIAAALEREILAKGAAEAEVLKRNEELYAALLSSISHDFRTPLASIIGASETLSLPGAVFSEETQHDILSMIREEAERLNRFVGNLLDMTKLEAGRLNPNLESIEITDIIGTAINRSERALHGHKLRVEVESGMKMVRADFVLVEHVLANLLENAAKYSPAGTTVTIQAERRGEEARISVIDQGCGIPPGELDMIFEKFYRVQQGDIRAAGTGLGLSICRGIIQAHEGTISASSPAANGRGTIITFTLPMADLSRSTQAAEIENEMYAVL